MAEFNDAEVLALTRASYVIREFRMVSPTITTPMMDLLLTVALNPGHGPNEYARRLQSIPPTISNQLAKLGQDASHRGEEPYELVKEGPPIGDSRGKGFYLSNKGKSLIRRILQAQGV